MPGADFVKDRGYALSGPSGTTLFVSANVFTGSLSATLEIRNDGSTPLLVYPSRVQMTARAGRSLPAYDRPGEIRCVDRHDASEVALAPGETCRMYPRFGVQPDPDELKTVVLLHDGVFREGVPLRVSVTFEKN